MIKGTDALGNIVRATVPVTLYYRFEMPLFNASFVYDLLIDGHKVGEICREYLAGYSFDGRQRWFIRMICLEILMARGWFGKMEQK